MDQPPDPKPPYPMCDDPTTLPSGTIVRVHNRIGWVSEGQTSLTLYIETPTPAAQWIQLESEARELVELHSEYADTKPFTGIGVAICRTPAQVKRIRLVCGAFNGEATYKTV